MLRVGKIHILNWWWNSCAIVLARLCKTVITQGYPFARHNCATLYIPILSLLTSYHYDSSSRDNTCAFFYRSHPRMTHLKVLTRLEYRSVLTFIADLCVNPCVNNSSVSNLKKFLFFSSKRSILSYFKQDSMFKQTFELYGSILEKFFKFSIAWIF